MGRREVSRHWSISIKQVFSSIMTGGPFNTIAFLSCSCVPLTHATTRLNLLKPSSLIHTLQEFIVLGFLDQGLWQQELDHQIVPLQVPSCYKCKFCWVKNLNKENFKEYTTWKNLIFSYMRSEIFLLYTWQNMIDFRINILVSNVMRTPLVP